MVDSSRVPADLAAGIPTGTSASPASSPLHGAFSPRCTGAGSGPCGNTPGLAPPSSPTVRYRHLLAQGVTGLSVAFDLPTQMGYDSDHALAAGEVGRVGVAIDTLDDMAALFDGIPLDRVSTSMTINSTAIILLAMYVALADAEAFRARHAFGNRAKRHPEGISRAWHLYLSAARVAAPRNGHLSRSVSVSCRGGTRYRSAAITYARPAPLLCRKWPSHWPTELPTSRRDAHGVCRRNRSARACPFSLPRTTTFSRRSRSFAPHGVCGRES